MKKILLRFILVYFFALFSLKLMGKRQIGEMQTTELVTTILLSELATYTATDPDIPIYFGLLPIGVMILIEVAISYVVIKVPAVKRVFDFSPSILIRDGKVSEIQMKKNRVTLDELLSLLRLAGYYDINKVRFAILEPNGQLSVVPYERFDQPCANDLGVDVKECGYSVALINDGKINQKALQAIGRDQNWLAKTLHELKISDMNEIFLLSSDFLGNVSVTKKDHKV